MSPGTPPNNVTQNVPHVISESGQVSGITCGGVSGQGNKPDEYPVTLHAPPRAVHHGDSGQGKNTPYYLHLLQNVCTVGGPKRPPPFHRLVHQGGGAEMVPAVC